MKQKISVSYDFKEKVSVYLFNNIYFLLMPWPSPVGDLLRWVFLKPFLKRSVGFFRIASHVTIYHPWRLELGEKVSINDYVVIDAFGGVKIGDNTRIAHRTTIQSCDHAFSDPTKNIKDQPYKVLPIEIGNDVWCGANSIILSGITIGNGSIVGAGAVVTKNVEPFSIVVGNPATKIKERVHSASLSP